MASFTFRHALLECIFPGNLLSDLPRRLGSSGGRAFGGRLSDIHQRLPALCKPLPALDTRLLALRLLALHARLPTLHSCLIGSVGEDHDVYSHRGPRTMKMAGGRVRR